jgi:hypothetical protein
MSLEFRLLWENYDNILPLPAACCGYFTLTLLRFFAEMRKRVSIRLPVPSIKRLYDQFFGLHIQTTNVDIISIRIGTRYIK